MAKKHTNLDGLEMVLSCFKQEGDKVRQGDGGEWYGAKTRLAEFLGLTRQTIHYWGKTGIPTKYLPKLRERTGLTNAQMVPELFAE